MNKYTKTSPKTPNIHPNLKKKHKQIDTPTNNMIY